MKLETTAEERAELLAWCKQGNRYPGSIWITIPRLLRDIDRLLAERAAPLPAEVEEMRVILLQLAEWEYLVEGGNPKDLREAAALLSRWPKEAGWQPTHKHLKSGGLYREIALGRLEWNLAPVVIYDNAKGEVWVRPAAEFYDGRFEPLPPAPKEEK